MRSIRRTEQNLAPHFYPSVSLQSSFIAFLDTQPEAGRISQSPEEHLGRERLSETRPKDRQPPARSRDGPDYPFRELLRGNSVVGSPKTLTSKACKDSERKQPQHDARQHEQNRRFEKQSTVVCRQT
jgi:hypothetical protein